MSFTLGLTFAAVVCATEGCGVTFALTDHYDDKRRQDHYTFYCPNGHRQHYPGQSDLEKERKLRQWHEEQARIARANLQGEKRCHANTKGRLTKVHKRIENGVCPHCNRYFKNLHRHMDGQHPKKKARGRGRSKAV